MSFDGKWIVLHAGDRHRWKRRRVNIRSETNPNLTRVFVLETDQGDYRFEPYDPVAFRYQIADHDGRVRRASSGRHRRRNGCAEHRWTMQQAGAGLLRRTCEHCGKLSIGASRTEPVTANLARRRFRPRVAA